MIKQDNGSCRFTQKQLQYVRHTHIESDHYTLHTDRKMHFLKSHTHAHTLFEWHVMKPLVSVEDVRTL